MSTIYYNTKEEAEKSKAERIPTEFCPLIKDTCRVDCICFMPVSVLNRNVYDHESRGYITKYQVRNGYCDNRMLIQE